MPKVCFLIFNLEPGGLQTYLLRFIEDSKNLLCISLVIKGKSNITLQSAYLKAGAKIVLIKSGYINVIGWYRIYKFLKGEKWNSVCDLTGNFAGVYMLLAKIAGIPNRIAYYGQASNHFRKTFFFDLYNRLVNKLVLNFSTGIISNSPNAMEFFFGKNWTYKGKIRVINNGVLISGDLGELNFSIRDELNIPKDSKIVLHVGRLDKNKNQQTILDVAELIFKERHNVFFIFCGKDTELLNSQIKSKHLKGLIFTIGYRADVEKIIQSADVFYFPSLSEGQPNALIEAILCGVPFIASDIPEIRQMIPENFRCQLVHPMDKKLGKSKILEILDGDIKYNIEHLRLYALEQFDPKKRFGEFRESITEIHDSR